MKILGYPVRLPFGEFSQRYEILSSERQVLQTAARDKRQVFIYYFSCILFILYSLHSIGNVI